ncbi:MAG: ABC transporter permease [Chloroflexaceae bacterium]|nr:ABC transporter permease [Chloroflexaceae bacterium]NJO04893.1 ABC transporter permease [Chloroflexaceae bacterium]
MRRGLRLLTTQRGGLRLYQWLWLLFCVVAALAVVAPRTLSQPLVYQTSAEVRFDTTRYAGLYDAAGNPSPDFQVALRDASDALRQRLLAERNVRFGAPNYRIAYVPQAPGVVQVQGFGATSAEAQTLANAAADELVRQVQAAGGREVLRNLLGWELVAALQGEAPANRFQTHLRAIIEQSAYPMNRAIEPVAVRMDVASLTTDERDDLTRSLESRYDLWTFEVNTRNAALDASCNTASITTTGRREAALAACAATAPTVAAELELRDQAIASRQSIQDALRYLLDTHDTIFMPEQPGPAFRVAADVPAAPVPRQIAPLLLLAVVAGLVFGTISVAVDRSAGVMDKLRDLWQYRALISNLVLRDLRARYKGSTLGYLWTQLAPLLLMLVFMFVFSLLLPTSIALFPVFLIVGLLPWNYCAEAITSGTRSIIDNANLIKKVYFPREVLPLASVFSSLLNLLLSLPMMFLVMALTQWLALGRLNFAWTFAYLPVLLIIQTLFLVGMTFFLSAFAVFVRDTVHLVGIVIQFWFFLTPVFYSLDLIGGSLARVVRWLNPMASIIEFYREILYGNTVAIGQIPTPAPPALDSMLRVLVTVLLILAAGYWFFQRQSAQFGEEL